MGMVETTAKVGRTREDLRPVNFLVDTGSFYSAIPPSLRDELGLKEGTPGLSQVADGRIVETELTTLFIELMERQAAIPVEIMDVPYPLLGATGLQALGLKVNSVEETLEQHFRYRVPPTYHHHLP